MRCSWMDNKVFSLFLLCSMYIQKVNSVCSSTIECIDPIQLNETIFQYLESTPKDFFIKNTWFTDCPDGNIPIESFSGCRTDSIPLSSGCQGNSGSNSYRVIYEKCWNQGQNPCHYSNDIVIKYSFHSDTDTYVSKSVNGLDWNPKTSQCEIKSTEFCGPNNLIVTCLHQELNVCPKYEFFGCESCDPDSSFVAEPTSFALPVPFPTIITNRTGINCNQFPSFCPSNCKTFSFPCCIPQLSPSLPPPPVIAESPSFPPSPPLLPPPPEIPPLASDVLWFKDKSCYEGIPITEADLAQQGVAHPQILFACVPPSSSSSSVSTVYDEYKLIDNENNIKPITHCYKRDPISNTFSLVTLRDSIGIYQCDLDRTSSTTSESCAEGYFSNFCLQNTNLNCNFNSQLIRTGIPCGVRPPPPVPPNMPPSSPPPPPPYPPPPPIEFASGFPMCASAVSSSCTSAGQMFTSENVTRRYKWSSEFILPNGRLNEDRVNSWLKEFHGYDRGKAQIVQWAWDDRELSGRKVLYFWTKYACRGVLFQSVTSQIQANCAWDFTIDDEAIGSVLPPMTSDGCGQPIGGIPCKEYVGRNLLAERIFSYNSSEYNIFDPPPLPPPPPPITSFVCVERFKPNSQWVEPFVKCKELDVYGRCKVNNNQIFEQFFDAEMIFMWCGLTNFEFTSEDCVYHLRFDQNDRNLNGQTFTSFVRPFDQSCPDGMSAYYCKCRSFSPPPSPFIASPPLPPPPPPLVQNRPSTANFKFPECKPSDIDIYHPTPCGYNVFRDCQPSACEFYAKQANQTGWTYGYPEARFWTSQPIPGIFDTTAVESTLDVNNSYYCPKFACRVTCKKSCIQNQAPSNPPAPSFPPEIFLPWYLTLPWWTYLIIGGLGLLLIVISIIFAPNIFTKECLKGILALISALRGANIPGLNPKILNGIESGINQSQDTFENLGDTSVPLKQRLRNAGKDAKAAVDKMKI